MKGGFFRCGWFINYKNNLIYYKIYKIYSVFKEIIYR